MIHIKTPQEIEVMAKGGKILAKILKELSRAVRPGATTRELEQLTHKLVLSHNVKPAFLGYEVAGHAYPAALCTSVNEEVVHGPPSDRTLNKGDIIGLDMGIVYEGWCLDAATTVVVENPNNKTINPKITKLIEVTKHALALGAKQARVGNHVGAIGYAVQKYVEKNGFGVVRDLVGHGIGRKAHEEPPVPNYGTPHEGPELKEGMVICIEPMITAGDWRVVLDKDGWTYRTKDGSWAAHFEHTIAITALGPRILTK